MERSQKEMDENISKEYPILSKINSPLDLENIDNLEDLCAEIRKKIIEVVSINGGHLASNLGVVELTAALYKVFNNPEDRIIWDVSHQSYAHKMLTGRFKYMDTIRKEGGISGYTNRKESFYDVFTTGHSSTSISSALGVAESKKILKEEGHVIAVIGDGSLTGGLSYEGLNNAGRFNKNFIIVLNDNKMSISKNVGAVARYLSLARIRPSYVKAKNILEKVLNQTKIGLRIKNIMKKSKSALKKIIYTSSMFEDMGFTYYGPVDGHNLGQLQDVLNIAKNLNKPSVVHVVTNKGKGYEFAEKDPGIYHGVSAFNQDTGLDLNNKKNTFSAEFGKAMCKAAEYDPRVCAITAAMTSGTGLKEFKSRYKSRFFDVGIAEEHGATFAGGLAVGGLIPVFAVYSSFLQRAYDQIIHDVSLQDVKVVFAVDRAGFVGDDGETHQGLFDVAFLNTVPSITIYAPSFFEEISPMLNSALFTCQKSAVVRYPRGGEFKKPEEFLYTGNDFDFYGDENADVLLITYGRIFSNAYFASQKLCEQGISTCVLKLNVIKPLPLKAVLKSMNFKKIIFFEEGIKSGGVSQKYGCMLSESNYKGIYKIVAVRDEFVEHASVTNQLKKYKLDETGMISEVLKLCGK